MEGGQKQPGPGGRLVVGGGLTTIGTLPSASESGLGGMA
jgi:hypothetical protein